ncbi:hypothetical protein FNO01nite_34010 [Flavobacterium noncentrifugens]|uniref:Carboxypeptidase regulatory-like domain-containing protein n=1 Tax=Flavobacterium noncentrifugens TaxID=1128970 RepID=A0A1G9DCH4_9FLAO|nr:carboxypeptidase regulatory-like domain-containing protein [Flavobacterium noncentrifugens]GEP52729.1 hypothetical protein FNO01nite_34010 [Flavobacterium noncentrifugens]SDK61569.1 hypothetical protein SAMN04487935_3778 [Flavobacterium noncentrifugens]
MKKSTKIFLLTLLILIIGIFIHPQKVIYEANIEGKVIDENNKPIINATVYRIEKEYYINEEIGSNESRDLRAESVKTDKNGNFKFYEKSRIDWFHTPLDLPIGYCYAEFEIEKSGYEFYKTKFGEFEQYRIENCYACEKVLFKPIITLKSLKENSRPKQN